MNTERVQHVKPDKISDQSILLSEVRQKIYPRAVSGTFAYWRWAMVWLTQILFFGLPWLSSNGRQSVLFDLGERKFYLFELILYPQDFIYLTGILVISALSLFLFTTIAGRLWCGYSCPQTVYTEIFLWIERKVEGDRNKRIKLDNSALSGKKLRLKTIKHTLWLLFALWTGLTFVGYFTPIKTLVPQAFTFNISPWQTFWVLFYTFATYGNAGFLREQVCKYMCPYARFQGVMFDRDTLVITYDHNRGDPRGARSKKANPRELGLGDCVDCGLCVQVCPTGIDIRNGQQYECIGCAACIDACDQVMDKIGYPKKLIAYNTLNRIDNSSSSSSLFNSLFRARVLVYFAILFTAVALLLGSLSTRVNFKVDVMRDRGTLAREVENGLIENVFRVMIVNGEETIRSFKLSVDGLKGVYIDSADTIVVDAASHKLTAVRVRAQPDTGLSGSNKIQFIVETTDDANVKQVEKTIFYLPHIP